MIELTCYDENGNTISYFTQWDLNRAIYIENPEFPKAPLALFSNNGSNSYLVATELTDNNEKIKIIVPNLLLQQCKTISMGLCSFDIINNINNTKYILKLPVRKLAMPTNYVFTDNAIDVNWLKNILGEYINEGITNIDDTTKYSISTINTSLSNATNSIDLLVNSKLEDINNTASTQIDTINATVSSQINAVNNTASAQIDAINNTAQAHISSIDSLVSEKLTDINNTVSTQITAINTTASSQIDTVNNTSLVQVDAINNIASAQIGAINNTAQTQTESIENLTEISISKLGYYIDTTDVNMLSESDSINTENYSTFVLTDDNGISENSFYIYVYQYDAEGNLIINTKAQVGEEIDISAASYITLWGAGSSGTFTVTYRMSSSIDVVNTITDLISRVSLLEEKTSNL